MPLKAVAIILALALPCMLATVWAIVDVARRDFGTLGRKARWWIVASVPFIGFVIYLIFGFRQGHKIQS